MANVISILALVCVLLGLSASTAAAPQRTTQGLQTEYLHQAGELLAPELKNFDYAAMYEQEMTPEQARALQTIMSQESSDDRKRAQMELFARRPSRPTVSGASAERLKDFGHFASINYCGDANSISTLSCGPKCSSPRVRNTRIVHVLQGGASFGFIALRPDQKQIIVSFRGSNNIQNWLDNLELIRINWPYPRPPNAGDISVHKGFTDVYNAIRSQVLSTVRELAAANPDFTVVSTGHSLGGALATIAAVDLVGTNTVPASRIELASFHSPRVGNGNLSSLISRIGFRAIDRIVQDNDIVPSIPPRFLGYEHTVGEKYIMGSTMYACQGTEDGSCSRSRVPFLSVLAHGRFFGVDMFFGRALGMGCGNNNLV